MPASATLEDAPPAKMRRLNALPLPMQAEETVARLSFAQRLTEEEIIAFCRDNPTLRVEQAANGDLLIMPPAHSETGQKNAELLIDFGIWARADGTGKVYDSSSGFRLPNKALYAPDMSWISLARIEQLSAESQKGFMKICPDFVLELRSASDRLPALQDKMVEYLENGVGLGWLIDPLERQVFIYRPGQPVEHLQNPATLSGEQVLAGFTLDLARIW